MTGLKFHFGLCFLELNESLLVFGLSCHKLLVELWRPLQIRKRDPGSVPTLGTCSRMKDKRISKTLTVLLARRLVESFLSFVGLFGSFLFSFCCVSPVLDCCLHLLLLALRFLQKHLVISFLILDGSFRGWA